jgi:hypothetical protein
MNVSRQELRAADIVIARDPAIAARQAERAYIVSEIERCDRESRVGATGSLRSMYALKAADLRAQLAFLDR